MKLTDNIASPSVEYDLLEVKRETYLLGGWNAIPSLAFYLKESSDTGTVATKVIRFQALDLEDVPVPEDPPEE